MRHSIAAIWATLCISLFQLVTARSELHNEARAKTYKTIRFRSSDVEAPIVNNIIHSSECDDSHLLFISPRGWTVKQPGPMIIRSNGELIWTKHFENEYGGQAYDFRVQRYQGEDYLTFWLGDDRIRGHGFGYYFMLNSSYDVVQKVGAADGRPADLHEFLITPAGTALVIVYDIIPRSGPLPGSGLANRLFGISYIWDNIVQEINIATGELLFSWRASEHININDTYHLVQGTGTQAEPFDWLHLNSIDRDENGNIVLSARYTHAIYYIDISSGNIMWTLGGKRNDFKDLTGGHALNFAWQHDARLRSAKQFAKHAQLQSSKLARTSFLTLFDNAAEDWNYGFGPNRSRGMLLELSWPNTEPSRKPHELHQLTSDKTGSASNALSADLSSIDMQKVSEIDRYDDAYTVRLVREYTLNASIRSSSQGSLQVLDQADGEEPHILVNYGLAAVIAEFKSSGDVLCDLRYAVDSSWETGNIQSYRAYKLLWQGRPRTPPSVTVKGTTVYMSWNGATHVHEWQLQTAYSPDEWSVPIKLPSQGFETAYELPAESHFSRYIRILAWDSNGLPCQYGERVLDRGRLTSLVRQHITTKDIDPRSVLLPGVMIFAVVACSLTFFLYRRIRPIRTHLDKSTKRF